MVNWTKNEILTGLQYQCPGFLEEGAGKKIFEIFNTYIFSGKIQIYIGYYLPSCVFLFWYHHDGPFALQSKIVQAKFEPNAVKKFVKLKSKIISNNKK